MLPFGGASDAPTLGDAVNMIDKAIDSFEDPRLAAPTVPEPHVLDPGRTDDEADHSHSVRQALRWLLPAGEHVLALVETDQSAHDLVVTTSRWGHVTLRDLLTAQSDARDPLGDALTPLEDLRHVVGPGPKDAKRCVEIVTREHVVTVDLTGIEEGTAHASAVDRTLCLLRTAMNLPDDEREHDPLLSRSQPACAVLPPTGT
ncbi:hypothetical protein [Actinomyces respiraculi]|uniref:hypothetical protein n=1 Tax=Actinomyces respiraculi TaxID=2744574 RepID=UPI00142034F0|nr:hypothetical protein [Actinomyces respiraculi]